MPSSTSSFEFALAPLAWLKILGGALLALAAVVVLLEWRLADLGYRATVLDSKEKWVAERQRASRLGERGLVMIGASRIQWGVDPAILQRHTGLKPIQLAIDNSPFLPILEGLAADPRIRGTVLIDYEPGMLFEGDGAQWKVSGNYQKAYQEQAARHAGFSLAEAEKYLTEAVHENLRSYADGTNPFHSIHSRVFDDSHTKQYLTTLPDRSRLADFRLMDATAYSYTRAARYLGMQLPEQASARTKERLLNAEIARLEPVANAEFLAKVGAIKAMVDQIQARGGRVVFVEMPTSGMVKAINQKKFPEKAYTDLFIQSIGGTIITADAIAQLERFNCPDGSHIDYRDRARLSEVIGQKLRR